MTVPPSGPLIAAHILGTFAMMGLIWFVQLVHYPLMRRFPEHASVPLHANTATAPALWSYRL